MEQEGHVTLDHPPEFSSPEGSLDVRIGYRVRSVAVCINPLQTFLIRTNPYLHRR